jgi:transcriptional regulator
VVPTWNYTVVHARGQLSFFHDPARLLDVVDRLTTRHEGQFVKPWSTADAPKDFIEAQLRGIVGIEIVIDSLEGKRKLSQNRPQADQDGVIKGLSASQVHSDHSVAELMRRSSTV